MRDQELNGVPCSQRRALLVAALALAPLAALPARAQQADQEEAPDPRWIGPQKGDRLVFLTGPKKGSPIHVDDLTLGAEQV